MENCIELNDRISLTASEYCKGVEELAQSVFLLSLVSISYKPISLLPVIEANTVLETKRIIMIKS